MYSELIIMGLFEFYIIIVFLNQMFLVVCCYFLNVNSIVFVFVKDVIDMNDKFKFWGKWYYIFLKVINVYYEWMKIDKYFNYYKRIVL